MRVAYDEDGFFRTGDTGTLEDGSLYVRGRASQDGKSYYYQEFEFTSIDLILVLIVIRFSVWHVHAYQVEEAICSHPEVSQAFVLGIASETEDQRVAALLVTKRRCTPKLSIVQLRRWLALERQMPAYMLPTALRILEPHQAHQVPVTVSGKPVKSKIRHDLFGQGARSNGVVELCDPLDDPDIVSRPFDWAGRQADGVSLLGI